MGPGDRSTADGGPRAGFECAIAEAGVGSGEGDEKHARCSFSADLECAGRGRAEARENLSRSDRSIIALDASPATAGGALCPNRSRDQ